jgi:hypothetical protein
VKGEAVAAQVVQQPAVTSKGKDKVAQAIFQAIPAAGMERVMRKRKTEAIIWKKWMTI